MILYGNIAKDAIEQQISNTLAKIREKGESVRIVTLRVGEDPADLAYEKQIRKRCASFEIDVVSQRFQTQAELIEAIERANEDDSIDGIMLFKPLPKTWNADEVVSHIAHEKDIDGACGENSDYVPCTAEACVNLIRAYGIDPKDKQCVVVGRSATVGRPLRMLLERAGASVTVCHSQTTDLPGETRKAELLFVACGKPKMIDASCVSPGQIVIDVGFHAGEDGICGDVDADAIASIVDSYSPVPRGVGSVTMPTLLLHAVQAHERRNCP